MLASVWFFIWGLLWAVFFMTDGYDLGLGSLLFWAGRNERERRAVVGTMAPFWDPNQVWLIAAGGMTFAVFPAVYATLFSTLYEAMMLILFGLIIRSVAFEFRNKHQGTAWRTFWDVCLAVGSFVPSVVVGVFFANLFRGLPIDGEGNLRGGFLGVLNGYGLLGGLLFFLMFALHGVLWMGVKTQGVLATRARAGAIKLWGAFLVVLIIFLVVTGLATPLYSNYLRHPALLILPALVVILLLLMGILLVGDRPWAAFFASTGMIFFITAFAMTGLFPNVVRSTLDPAYSLTVFNSSSSALTLKIMLVVSVVFVPIILFYVGWAHYLFRSPVSDEEIRPEEEY